MNVSDYTSKLNGARDQYNKASTRLREDYKNTLENQSKVHELKEEKQAENYKVATREQEENIGKISDSYVNQTREEIKKRQNRFNNDLGAKREAYEAENKRLRENMTSNLDLLKGEYDKNIYEREKNHAEIVSDIKNRYAKSDSIMRDQFNTSSKDLQKKSKETLDNYIDAETLEKKNMINEHRREVQKNLVDNNIEQNRVSNKHQKSVEQLRNVFEIEKQSMKDYHDGSQQQIRNQHKEDSDLVRNNFESLAEGLTKKNEYEKDKLIKGSKNNLEQLEKQFNKDRHELNRKSNAIISTLAGNDSGKVENNRLENAHNAMVTKLKQSMADQKETDYESKLNMDEMNRESLRAQSSASLDVRDKLEKENNDFNREVIGSIRKQKDDAIFQYSKQLQDLDKITKEQLIREKNYSNKILENQRSEFAKNINQISEKNLIASDEMRDNNARATRDLVENNRRIAYLEKENIKEEMSSKINKTEQRYEQQLEEKNKNLQNLSNFYENKIQILAKKSAKEMETQRIYEEERRLQDQRAYKKEMEARDEITRQEMINQREFFGKTLDKTKLDGDIRLSRLTSKYEDLLIDQQKNNDRELTLKMNEARENYQNLFKKSEIEKAGIRNQYEMKIDKIKATNLQQMENLIQDKGKKGPA